MFMSKEKVIIIFTVAIDVIGLGIIIPVLPVYVESFGVSAFAVTMLVSVFSLFSFLSAPILGALSDKYGRRPILMASIASTGLGWMIFAAAKSLPMLALGRIIDGMAAGNFSTAQSAISDISKDQKERTAALGMIGMIFGLGFIVGPFIGGLLSKVSHSFPFWFVGGLAVLNVILAYFMLPETNKQIDIDRKISTNPLKPIVSAVRNEKLRKLYLVYFIFNVVTAMANSVFALYLAGKFGFNAFTTGLFFTGVGVVLAINQGFLLRKFWLEKFKEKQLILIMSGLFVVGFLMMAAGWIGLFVVGMLLTALGQSTIGAAMTSEIVGEADVKARGEAVGVLSAVASVAMIVAPLMSGALFVVDMGLPFVVGSALSVISWLLMRGIKTHDRINEEIVSEARKVTDQLAG